MEFRNPKSEIIGISKGIYKEANDEEKREIWKRMKELGFIRDEINNIYFREGYGALMGTAGNFKTIDELINTTSRIFDGYKKLINEGYELIIGPGFPDLEGNINSKAIYCKNFQVILRRQKEDKEFRRS